jgi:hypothetical protein
MEHSYDIRECWAEIERLRGLLALRELQQESEQLGLYDPPAVQPSAMAERIQFLESALRGAERQQRHLEATLASQPTAAHDCNLYPKDEAWCPLCGKLRAANPTKAAP